MFKQLAYFVVIAASSLAGCDGTQASESDDATTEAVRSDVSSIQKTIKLVVELGDNVTRYCTYEVTIARGKCTRAIDIDLGTGANEERQCVHGEPIRGPRAQEASLSDYRSYVEPTPRAFDPEAHASRLVESDLQTLFLGLERSDRPTGALILPIGTMREADGTISAPNIELLRAVRKAVRNFEGLDIPTAIINLSEEGEAQLAWGSLRSSFAESPEALTMLNVTREKIQLTFGTAVSAVFEDEATLATILESWLPGDVVATATSTASLGSVDATWNHLFFERTANERARRTRRPLEQTAFKYCVPTDARRAGDQNAPLCIAYLRQYLVSQNPELAAFVREYKKALNSSPIYAAGDVWKEILGGEFLKLLTKIQLRPEAEGRTVDATTYDELHAFAIKQCTLTPREGFIARNPDAVKEPARGFRACFEASFAAALVRLIAPTASARSDEGTLINATSRVDYLREAAIRPMMPGCRR